MHTPVHDYSAGKQYRTLHTCGQISHIMLAVANNNKSTTFGIDKTQITIYTTLRSPQLIK